MRKELYVSDSWRTAQVSVCETRQEALGPFTQDMFLRSICAIYCYNLLVVLHKHASYGRCCLLWSVLLIFAASYPTSAMFLKLVKKIVPLLHYR